MGFSLIANAGLIGSWAVAQGVEQRFWAPPAWVVLKLYS